MRTGCSHAVAGHSRSAYGLERRGVWSRNKTPRWASLHRVATEHDVVGPRRRGRPSVSSRVRCAKRATLSRRTRSAATRLGNISHRKASHAVCSAQLSVMTQDMPEHVQVRALVNAKVVRMPPQMVNAACSRGG